MRLNKQDWLARGLDVLTRLGPEHLKVDRLCKHLGVTKGSFYHHYANRDHYVESLLDYWQAQNTKGVIAAVEELPGARQKSLALSNLAQQIDSGPENAMRAWARYDERVAERVQSVDQMRIDYLAGLLPSMIPDADIAPLLSKLIYSHLIGMQQLGQLVSVDEWQKMDQLLRRAFTVPPPTDQNERN